MVKVSEELNSAITSLVASAASAALTPLPEASKGRTPTVGILWAKTEKATTKKTEAKMVFFIYLKCLTFKKFTKNLKKRPEWFFKIILDFHHLLGYNSSYERKANFFYEFS